MAWNDAYIRRTKKNQLHLGKATIEYLTQLTKYMTTTCFLGRPDCKECPLHGDELYCPPYAARAELNKRGIVGDD